MIHTFHQLFQGPFSPASSLVYFIISGHPLKLCLSVPQFPLQCFPDVPSHSSPVILSRPSSGLSGLLCNCKASWHYITAVDLPFHTHNPTGPTVPKVKSSVLFVTCSVSLLSSPLPVEHVHFINSMWFNWELPSPGIPSYPAKQEVSSVLWSNRDDNSPMFKLKM